MNSDASNDSYDEQVTLKPTPKIGNNPESSTDDLHRQLKSEETSANPQRIHRFIADDDCLASWRGETRKHGKCLGVYNQVIQTGAWRFGAIFEAEHSQLHRRVMLFSFDRPWSQNVALKTWFLNLSRSIASIHDTNVGASVLECNEIDGVVFIATAIREDEPRLDLSALGTSAHFQSSVEPISQTFWHAAQGLATFHRHRLVHGSIGPKNLHIGDNIDEIQFAPLAVGVPESELLDEMGKLTMDRTIAIQNDFRSLARAFISKLLGESEALPKKLSTSWFRRRLPFVPNTLAKILTRLANRGAATHREKILIHQLDQIRHEPLRGCTWMDRIVHLLHEGVYVFVSTAMIALILWSFFGYSATNIIFWISVFWFLGVIIFWEPLFNTTIGKHTCGYFLVDTMGKTPSFRQRLLRSMSRAFLWIVVAALFSFGLNSLPHWLFEGETARKLTHNLDRSFSFFASLVPSAFVVYATAFLFRGSPIHDWLSQTRWVCFQRAADGPSLAVCHRLLSEDATRLDANTDFPDSSEEFKIAHIRICGELGVGGMGVVYRGWDETLARPVAVKLITTSSAEAIEAVQRFQREAKLGAKIDHPHIAKVYSAGLFENQPYIEMEYVHGENLLQIVKRHGAISVERAWDVIRQAALGLNEASQLGIVHRDIKPSNLMLTKDGIVKVMDFGISKSTDDGSAVRPETVCEISMSNSELETHAELTRAGALLGTPQYMSPEQARCEALDVRSDIYSLGVTLYYMLVGKLPFESKSTYDLIMQHCTQPPPPLPARLLDVDQTSLLEKMLEKSKENRYGSYEELIRDLARTQPVPARIPGFTRRISAYVVDNIAIWGLFILLLYMYVWLNNPVIEFMLGTVYFMFAFSYLCGCVKWFGGTPGQRMLGLKVVRHDGTSIGWGQLILRCLVKHPALPLLLLSLSMRWLGLVSSESAERQLIIPFATTILIVSCLFLQFTRHKLALHDLIAATRVLYLPNKLRRSSGKGVIST